MATKVELENRVSKLEHELRRVNRALGQAQLDIDVTVKQGHNHLTPAVSEHARTAIKRAQAEWDKNIVDPCSRIDTYIKSSEGLGWGWEKPYVKNGQFAWCGAFASYCYASVSANTRKKIFPSCYRMYSNWATTSRKISVDAVQAGDIVVIYTSKRSVQGDHITLCVDASTVHEGYISTIEGNAHGELADGSYGEGVIKQKRELDKIAHVYRLLSVDFDE